jgi:uncharacterized protein YrrD
VNLKDAKIEGRVDDVLLDLAARRVRGVRLKGVLFLGGQTIMDSMIASIGMDAITVREPQQGASDPAADKDAKDLPLLSQVIGTKLVSHTGTLVGMVREVLIDHAQLQITGFEIEGVEPHAAGPWVLHADPRLVYGKDLIVLPDDLVPGGQNLPPPSAP